MNYFIYLFFAILPSLIWLVFYLRQDKKPEPIRMVIKIFILGMIFAIAVIAVQKYLAMPLYEIGKNSNFYLSFILYVFIGIGFIEELFKYLVVKTSVMKSAELDEPFDVVLYLIIASLGFAALENLLVFLRYSPTLLLPSIEEMAQMSFWRMITATLLHVLCSGILGSFLALGFYNAAKKTTLATLGIIFASFLHGFYDFSIMDIGGSLKIIIMAILLVSMSFLLWAFILKIKKLPSLCK